MEGLTIGFIGFGLIGGSIAHALKEINKNCNLIAYHYNPAKMNANLDAALFDGTLDLVTCNLSEGFEQCDIIFLCAPVLTNISYLPQLKSILKPTCIITDVGSVKGNIHEAIHRSNLEANFIGGHPMAGSEKTGYQNSSSKILENAFYILTPTKQTPGIMVERMYQIVEGMGAIPIILDDQEHDDITAAISHVPHIIASTLVNMIKTCDGESEKMRSLAAGGFKDITRIASSSPVMWQNICLTNASSIKKFLQIFRSSIDEFITALEQQDGNYLFHSFETAKEYRDTIPNKSIGMLSKIFEVFIDIKDETGSIATIASILASNSISIKNIGIIHNREFEAGVLRIELYDQRATDKSIDLLTEYNYTIYER